MKHSLIAIMFLLLLAVPARALDSRPFPDLELAGVLTAELKASLGVTSNTFKLSEIKSDYLVVEAYSMYCPICQRDAPAVNELYRQVTEADTKGTVRFIGLGMGNSGFETGFYQTKFQVPFALFADENFAIHKALGETGTPTFYIVSLKGSSPEMLYMREGDPEEGLLDIILTTTKIR
jgi:peroxiredoxin